VLLYLGVVCFLVILQFVDFVLCLCWVVWFAGLGFCFGFMRDVLLFVA